LNDRLTRMFHIALFVLAASWGLGVCAYAAGAPQQYGYGQNQGRIPDPGPPQSGWDVPPPNMSQIQADGFRTGILAGQDDISHQIQPNATNRPEYRNPPKMSFLQRAMYRDGFQKGYQRAMDRFYGTPAPPPPPPQPAYMPPPPVEGPRYRPGHDMEYRHQGYQEGMLGALHDTDHNRRPDPNNRDEFRQPNVPYEAVRFYREGFRRGYDEAMDAMTGMPNDIARGSHGDVMMRAYHEGAAGAIRDWDNHRRPDPNNRDEFRQPAGPPDMQHLYRDSFRRGYMRIAGQIYDNGPRW